LANAYKRALEVNVQCPAQVTGGKRDDSKKVEGSVRSTGRKGERHPMEKEKKRVSIRRLDR